MALCLGQQGMGDYLWWMVIGDRRRSLVDGSRADGRPPTIDQAQITEHIGRTCVTFSQQAL
jgi:hypothetical protein